MSTAPELTLRPIRPSDDSALAAVIRTVMPEFGAGGEGFAIQDAEVDKMSAAYGRPRHAYFVIEKDGRVVGGGGIGPLVGGPEDTCELRKMYFLPEARGAGMGERLLRHCLAAAAELGFKRCYLETLCSMKAAMGLYEKLGFQRRDAPLGATGHFGCNRWYELALPLK